MKKINLRYLSAGVVLAGILIGTVWILRGTHSKVPSFAESFPRSKGSANAPIQVIEYSDFQCPSCRWAQIPLANLLLEKSGKIRLIFQHFPLQGHPWSPLAHQAAECAAGQGQFWVYHDRLYNEQTLWSKATAPPVEDFLRFAREAGLDLDRFAACLGDRSIEARIRQEHSTGLDLGVRSTPSFFVNGKLVVGVVELQKEIEKLLLK